ncbi:hypothetical protein C4J81_13675 [Deltaproteobacteria bacterium Smac51]|nr:hypothetical protein C4J81_13675 [Deltaproteobacteria bacterium Smac51]
MNAMKYSEHKALVHVLIIAAVLLGIWLLEPIVGDKWSYAAGLFAWMFFELASAIFKDDKDNKKRRH